MSLHSSSNIMGERAVNSQYRVAEVHFSETSTPIVLWPPPNHRDDQTVHQRMAS
jgi:hypothetical protein